MKIAVITQARLGKTLVFYSGKIGFNHGTQIQQLLPMLKARDEGATGEAIVFNALSCIIVTRLE